MDLLVLHHRSPEAEKGAGLTLQVVGSEEQVTVRPHTLALMISWNLKGDSLSLEGRWQRKRSVGSKGGRR